MFNQFIKKYGPYTYRPQTNRNIKMTTCGAAEQIR